MQYLGGKSKLAKRLASVLELHRHDGQRFVDVFGGSLAITAAMSDRGPRVANDACAPLICLFQAWREGWRPPIITEDLYEQVKSTQDPSDPLTAFVGFGCTYGGKWFGGYARGWFDPIRRITTSQASGGTEPFDYAAKAARSIERRLNQCRNVTLTCLDFHDVQICADDLVYADPEYKGTTRYNYFRKPFDYAGFMRAIDDWLARGAAVFVSEYEAQSSTWELVGEWSVQKSQFKGRQVERLYRVMPP